MIRRFLLQLDRLSFAQLGLIWLALVVGSGLVYWLLGIIDQACLLDRGQLCGQGIDALGTAIYFSFITATSVGFGDVVPVGAARPVAVIEGGAALLIFGLLVQALSDRIQLPA